MLIKNQKVDSLSKDYKGITYIKDFKCFIDEALPEDVVDIEIYKEKSKTYFAKINKIIKKSIYRNENIPCPYYKKCGGCSLQHLNIDYYYKIKKEYIQKLFNIENVDIFKTTKRRRINLKYSNGKYGFFNKNTTNLVAIDNCIILTEKINNIIKLLNENCIKITNLSSLDIFEVDNGIGINLIFSKEPNINEFKKIDFLKNLVISINYTYEDRKEFIPIIKNEDLFLTLQDFKIKLPNTFFMQATKESQDFMIDFICKEIKNYNLVYDLYCGIGTYSFPLTKYNKKVKCFEGNDLMINSIKTNSKNLDIRNLFFETKDLFNQPIIDFKNVDALIINPPRNGAGNQCKYINKSNINKIIYVSCNPESFKKDLELLSNYKLKKVVLVDQFIFSNHIEIITILEK